MATGHLTYSLLNRPGSEQVKFFVTNEAEQIPENKATLGNFMTNEVKNEAWARRK
jgi:hypothetical protein